MARSVAVVVFDGISPFHLSVPCMVLGERFEGWPALFDVTVCAQRPGRVATNAGFALDIAHGLDVLDTADFVIIPSWDPPREPDSVLLSAIRAAHARGAVIVGLCLGSYVVAASGLADGRELVTHWGWAARMASRFPHVQVRADVLWSDHGDVLTSAGTAAALDCCLHLVRRECGAEPAARVARAIVVAPHRSGSQAQFIQAPVSAMDGDDPIERAMVWARAHLDRPVSLDEWARVAAMSRRTFTRNFRARTGASCGQWLLNQRLDRARILLETTAFGVERVAAESGFATAATLRHHFRQTLGTTPQRHRADFRER
ncbi:GlxA family transcriptional regulator [Allorhizocola rhizosphaerae]|uniref:GlxA family transcriptional regulator n=1 Tax=Allorhizocola rhizosphaerae TaxID=1872709 RepID=UPI000E3BA7EF|nr:helix-turn-helix domain-containing protein [Allorhizocola rhizosphaerae]